MSFPDNVYVLRRPDSAFTALVRTRVPLWNLAPECLCPLIGSCLGADRLRRLLDELFEARSELPDFELHAGVVRECGSRNKISELLQGELDRLHVDAIRALDETDDPSALAEAWIRAAGRGDVAAALWAVLTHPDCSAELTGQVLRDLHMIQHRAMGAMHVQLDLGDRLAAENVRLHAELAAKVRECEQLRSALARPVATVKQQRWHWRRFFPVDPSAGQPQAAPR